MWKEIKEKDCKKSEIVLITYPVEKDYEKLAWIFEAKRVLIESFHSCPPGEGEDEGVCTVAQIKRVVDFLQQVESKKDLIVLATADIKIIINTVVLLAEMPIKYALASVVKEIRNQKPSIWIACLFDHVLQLEGELVKEVEEYLATGIAVTQQAVIVEAEW
jgi:predicted protein tyrosine phosphatase